MEPKPGVAAFAVGFVAPASSCGGLLLLRLLLLQLLLLLLRPACCYGRSCLRCVQLHCALTLLPFCCHCCHCCHGFTDATAAAAATAAAGAAMLLSTRCSLPACSKPIPDDGMRCRQAK